MKKLFPIFVILSLAFVQPSFAQESSAPDSITDTGNTKTARLQINEPTIFRLESLTKQIAKKETELLRLNTQFRIECTKTSKWKPWRMFLYNLGASGCSEAGITSIAATRWRFQDHPRSMSRPTATAGPILLLIGHCITLGGVMTETTLDAINDYKVRKKGLDIKTTYKRVLELKTDLDKLLSERDDVVTQACDLTPAEKEIALAESAVLKDIRNLALSEYAQFYVRAHKFFAARDANTVMAIIASTTGGFQGSLLGILSAAHRRPKLVGPGGLGFIISGAAIVATPPAMRLTANIRGKAAGKRLAEELGDLSAASLAKLDQDCALLNQLASNKENSNDEYIKNVPKRLEAYQKKSALLTAQKKMNENEKNLADKEFKERVVFASLIGGSKMSWGINLANAGFQYNPRTLVQAARQGGRVSIIADPAPAKIFTRRVAIGATTYVPGVSLWILDTLQNRIRGEKRTRVQMAQKKLPGGLLKERMDRVEEIDSMFNY